MIKKLDHIVITTDDAEKCCKFYEKLGFCLKKSGQRYELFAGDFKINVHIKGKELLPHAANVTTGSSDICIETEEDLADFKDRLGMEGIVSELSIVSRTGVRGPMSSLYLRDPDGNLLEFCNYN